MGGRINTIMQTCFFAISGVLPRDEAIAEIKKAIEKTYGKRGEAVVQQNFAAVDAHPRRTCYEVTVPGAGHQPPSRAAHRARRSAGFRPATCSARSSPVDGDDLPVSAMPVDGTFPTGTTQWEKRNIALEIPVWDADLCIQCGKCVLVCPHAVIRQKVYDPALLADAPATFKSDATPSSRNSPGHEIHRPGCPRRLHRLRAVRGSLPGQGQDPGRTQGPQHGSAAARCARARAANWDFFLKLPGPGPQADQPVHDQELAVTAAAVRILRRLLRLRRNPLRQAGLAALRRPDRRRQRHRLLLHLRRQPADHPVGD